ncbi:MAG: DUF6338 family protein [Candidatus Thiosymbion ectosymbiont of Robbea hypermnestra]|nr:DUF6338 family protein [Candidatus Thiosymbion ectosymbiont of Robbea hypermnestra]
MGGISKELVSILQFLLPGFVAAWIFYGLTPYPKPSPFERVVQALIFTLFIQALVIITEYTWVSLGHYWNLWPWNESSSLIASILIAVLFGITFSYFANNDKIHKLLRAINITRETSFPSEWYDSFSNNVTFVVLHFNDERRLYGWPIKWPSKPEQRHFLMVDPAWIEEDGKEKRITGVKSILVDVKDVKWVEFLENTWEKENG